MKIEKFIIEPCKIQTPGKPKQWRAEIKGDAEAINKIEDVIDSIMNAEEEEE